jgi:energy-coupling factor transporter ATP-binding protein EcfA2
VATALFPTAVTISGLFGHVDHSIDLSSKSPVNVLTGPNGCGKTHTLRLIRAALSLDFNELLALPFKQAGVALSDGSALGFSRTEGKISKLQVSRVDRHAKPLGSVSVTSQKFDPTAGHDLTPSWLHPVGDDQWIDDRTDRLFTSRDLERRFGIRVPDRSARAEVIRSNSWLRSLDSLPAPVFVDTKRLDTVPMSREDDPYSRTRAPRYNNAVGRINQYIEQIRSQIGEAKRLSLAASQSADEQFAYNLMNVSRAAVKQDLIETEYERLAELNAALSLNGLSGRPIDVVLPTRMNPTEKRVMNLFLSDWVSKLDPLLPVHRKLSLLRKIIEQKFIGKTIEINDEGGLEFKSRGDGGTIPVNQLSSGEQHLLALFTQLIFAAEAGSTVLIDEPEISLHAAWKHEFLDDMEEVARLSQLVIIMATHSTAIINGRWDIVSELGVE